MEQKCEGEGWWARASSVTLSSTLPLPSPTQGGERSAAGATPGRSCSLPASFTGVLILSTKGFLPYLHPPPPGLLLDATKQGPPGPLSDASAKLRRAVTKVSRPAPSARVLSGRVPLSREVPQSPGSDCLPRLGPSRRLQASWQRRLREVELELRFLKKPSVFTKREPRSLGCSLSLDVSSLHFAVQMEPSWAQTLLLLGCCGFSTLLRSFAWAAEECIRGNGISYRGSQQVSSTGAPCLNWLEQDKRSVFPNLTVSETHNYCRNPDGDAAPWCYVRGEAGIPERSLCSIPQCPGAAPTLIVKTAVVEGTDQVFESANDLPARSEAAAVQPVVGISQRVKMRPNEKKDLGTLGYVLGLIMMVIIIAIGAGIAVGYVYKRGKDLKQQHEQKVYEREMQRITLPLSAFTNQACELVDENTIVVHTNQTPVEELHDGDAPLMGQAGTPGA